jgi:hypothetical protein
MIKYIVIQIDTTLLFVKQICLILQYGYVCQLKIKPWAGHLCEKMHMALKSPYNKVLQGADKSLARPTSRCILFDGENISFDASLVMYINSTNVPPIMIINRTYENKNLLSL